MIIAFFGHSSINNYSVLRETIEKIIREVIKKCDSISFYCGGYGAFDGLCAEVCRCIKSEYRNCELIFITPYITELQQQKMKELIRTKQYDGCLYPSLENVPPRFAISKRNEWIANEADLIICYVNHSFGGAYKAVDFARRRKKKIINLGSFTF